MAHIRANFRVYLWVTIVVLILTFQISDLIFDILFPYEKFSSLSTWSKISCYYAYFTTQTNLFVLIYLLINLSLQLFNKIKKQNVQIDFFVTLGFTVYITITMMIYWGGLAAGFFSVGDPDPNSPFNKNISLLIFRWISTSILHAVVPIFMIINYLVIACGVNHYSLKEHHFLQLWLLLIYPFVYLIYVFVRGEIRFATNQPLDTCYPYDFFNYRKFTNDTTGWLTVAGFFFVLVIVVILLQYFYLSLNNVIYRNKLQKTTADHP